jgi:hypothetical protein
MDIPMTTCHQVFIPCPSTEQIYDSEEKILEHALVTHKALEHFLFTYLSNCDLAHQYLTQPQFGWAHWPPKTLQAVISMGNVPCFILATVLTWIRMETLNLSTNLGIPITI